MLRLPLQCLNVSLEVSGAHTELVRRLLIKLASRAALVEDIIVIHIILVLLVMLTIRLFHSDKHLVVVISRRLLLQKKTRASIQCVDLLLSLACSFLLVLQVIHHRWVVRLLGSNLHLLELMIVSLMLLDLLLERIASNRVFGTKSVPLPLHLFP